MGSNGQATVTSEKAAGDRYNEIGSTGLRQQGGVIAEEFLRELKGQKGRKAIREMAENDPVIGGCLLALDMLVRQVEWRVDPNEEDPQGEENANFVWSCFNDMSESWNDTLSSILSFLPYGWSYHEIVYKLRRGPEQGDGQFRSKFDDGKIGWRKMPIRSQDTLVRWVWDEQGGLAGMEQAAAPNYHRTLIPIDKSLLFRTTAQKANPEGRSILRNAYRPWFFKKRIEEVEGVGIERDLAGFPVIYAPARLFLEDASAGDKAILETLKRQVRNVKRDEQEGLVFPMVYDDKGNQLYKFELVTTGGRRQFDTDATISRYDQRIAMAFLADWMLLGHERTGSYALSSSKMDMFTLALASWIDGITAVFNTHGIPRLLRLNGMDSRFAPRLAHDEIKDVDLGDLTNFLDKTAGAGLITPDADLEDTLREYAGLPPANAALEV